MFQQYAQQYSRTEGTGNALLISRARPASRRSRLARQVLFLSQWEYIVESAEVSEVGVFTGSFRVLPLGLPSDQENTGGCLSDG